MRKITYLGIAVLALVVLVSIISLFVPSTAVVNRSVLIHAPAASVFENVNSMPNWKNWGGPWQEEGMDFREVIQKTEGPQSGVGSKLIYNQGQGDGSVEIIECRQYSSVTTRISFEDGGSAYGVWHFKQNKNVTLVNWTIHVDLGYNPIKRIMGNLMMEDKVGPLFNKGLANLKRISE